MKSLLKFLIVFITLSNVLYAEEFNYHVGTSVSNQITTEYMDVRYDNFLKTFTIEAKFNNTAGKIADGFHFAVSDSSNFAPGQLAFIYFDASYGLNNAFVTGYAYNANTNSFTTCANNTGSWRNVNPIDPTSQPDAVFSSVYNPDVVLEKTVAEQIIGGKIYRTFRLVLDASSINVHIPAFGNVWKGLKFGSLINLRFWASSIASSSYASGSISSYSPTYTDCQLINLVNRTSNSTPFCAGISVEANTLSPGEPIKIRVNAWDREQDYLYVSYSNLPAGAVGSIPAGTRVRPDTNGNLPVTINWIPSTSQLGVNHFNITFVQDYGEDQASVSCPLAMSIDYGCPPTCGLTGNTMNLNCTSNRTTASLDGSSSYDVDNAPAPLKYTWTSNCPSAQISNQGSAKTNITFNSETFPGTSTVCKAFLTVNDGTYTSTCSREVSVKSCNKDCAGTINGTAVVDQCGVCGGNNACLDCLGVPNGSNKPDQCGVCNGDGTSCLGCEDINVSGPITSLDNGTDALYKYVARTERELRRLKSSSAADKKSVEQAGIEHTKAWTAINSIPTNFAVCTNTSLCVSVSHASSISTYSTSSTSITKIGQSLIAKYKRVLQSKRRSTKPADTLLRELNKQNVQNQKEAASLPTSSSSCS